MTNEKDMDSPAPDSLSLLDSRFLRRLECLSIRARQIHPGPLPALHATPLRGSGLEFADHQPYAPGDDLRYLDWNVYARHGQLLVKRFQEERDLRVDLLVDASRSMMIGQPSKWDYAKRVLAAMAYVALAGLDRVAVTLFADQIVGRYPIIRGKNQILSLLRYLEQQSPQGTDTNLDVATQSLTARSEPSGVAIIISDFLDTAGYRRAIDRLRHRRFDVYLLQVLDASELASPLRGDVELVDVETGRVRPVVVRERTQRLYAASWEAFRKELRVYARRHGMGFISTTTEVPFEHLVLHMMRQSDWLVGS